MHSNIGLLIIVKIITWESLNYDIRGWEDMIESQ